MHVFELVNKHEDMCCSKDSKEKELGKHCCLIGGDKMGDISDHGGRPTLQCSEVLLA